MAKLPEREQQIVQAHAALIVAVVEACQNPAARESLAPVLEAGEQHGQQVLVAAIRRVLAGEREPRVAAGLDADDTVVVTAILRGLQNPASLPDPEAQGDPAAAAPGLAHMIHAAAHGNAEALQMLGHMAEQMQGVGGDMARVGGILRRVLNGERDADRLGVGMSASGRSLVSSLLEELARLEAH